ncbi:MAG: hypothetical protein AAF184_25485, partial [Pseudomonadota bacterium]
MPANLPYESSAVRSDVLGIDGDWRIREIGKRIRVDRGIAYALDPWVHAVLWRVNPGMVVMQNIELTTDGRYEADDLPLQGRSTMTLQADGTIRVLVAGAFGPVNLVLEPVTEVVTLAQAEPPRATATSSDAAPRLPAPVPIGRRRPLQEDLPEFRSWESFTGCDGEDEAVPEAESPRERMENANRVDKIAQR